MVAAKMGVDSGSGNASGTGWAYFGRNHFAKAITSAPRADVILRHQLEHPPVAAVADVDRPVRADGDAVRLAQLDRLRRPADAGRALLASPGEADDLAVRRVAADAVVLRVGDEYR